MTFARKIFAAIFISTLVVGSLLIWASYSFFEKRAEEDFRSRYGSLTRILSDALTRLDVSNETLMRNAAMVIADRDRMAIPTEAELRELRSQLGVTHAFVIDSSGKFIRSSNEPVSKIPNLFSFSPDYRRLLTGESESEATPIILPKPEFAPYKFLSIPSFDHERIIEVGVRVDSITKTLAEAVRSDDDVQKMTLYNPGGTEIATFSTDGAEYKRQLTQLPSDFSAPVIEGTRAHFFARVDSSHEKCSQCDIAHVSIGGRYYYVLESTVATQSLDAARTLATQVATLFFLLNGFIAWFAATLISKRLVRNIKFAVARVREIGENRSASARVGLSDGTEISYLTKEFDRLLDTLEVSQQQAVAAQIMSSKVELAKVIAHNIKSPLVALDMILPLLNDVDERTRKVLRSAVDEIKSLSIDLKRASEGESISPTQFKFEEFDVRELVTDLVRQKRFEYNGSRIPRFEVTSNDQNETRVHGCPSAIRGVLSNLINNAVEAYSERSPEVVIRLSTSKSSCEIAIQDFGSGIDSSKLSLLGHRSFSTKRGVGRGIGVVHARSAVEANGGRIKFSSTLGKGTTVTLVLPVPPALDFLKKKSN